MTASVWALLLAGTMTAACGASAEPRVTARLQTIALADLPANREDPNCREGLCRITLTPKQLLARASNLVAARKFEEARPLVDALVNVPSMGMERHFLAGFIAVETGDLKTAIKEFRASLAVDPKQTRVRLELARAMMLSGKDGGADYNFRLAQQDETLNAEMRATIMQSRGILRDRKPWHLSSEFGFAPDTNITNGTQAQTVDVVVGNQTIPFKLDPSARARSGIGQTGSLSAGYRFKVGDRAALLVDADAQGVNYTGTANDDFTVQFAAGPEFRPSEATSFSIQGIGLQRRYGGALAVTQIGGRAAFQHSLAQGERMAVTLDLRHSKSGFQDAYSGLNLSAYATYERVIARSMIASASVFARTDRLNSPVYSNREFGLSLGMGGELAYGINAGISGSVSRATYEATMAGFADAPRADWRASGRIYAGLRSVRLAGFSPSVSCTYSLNASSMDLYTTRRSRLAFNLARYF